MTDSKASFLAALASFPMLLLGFSCSDGASLGRDRGLSSADDSSQGGTKPTGGGSAGTGGSSSGASGSDNGASGSGNGSPDAGTECEEFQCVRPIYCVTDCNQPLENGSCCPCGPGTFDHALTCQTEPDPDGQAPVSLENLNTNCVDGTCPDSWLTPVKFYGVAGTAGPEFCWCTIPCEQDPTICPETTSCVATGDGPGTVCMAD